MVQVLGALCSILYSDVKWLLSVEVRFSRDKKHLRKIGKKRGGGGERARGRAKTEKKKNRERAWRRWSVESVKEVIRCS